MNSLIQNPIKPLLVSGMLFLSAPFCGATVLNISVPSSEFTMTLDDQWMVDIEPDEENPEENDTLVIHKTASLGILKWNYFAETSAVEMFTEGSQESYVNNFGATQLDSNVQTMGGYSVKVETLRYEVSGMTFVMRQYQVTSDKGNVLFNLVSRDSIPSAMHESIKTGIAGLTFKGASSALAKSRLPAFKPELRKGVLTVAEGADIRGLKAYRLDGSLELGIRQLGANRWSVPPSSSPLYFQAITRQGMTTWRQ